MNTSEFYYQDQLNHVIEHNKAQAKKIDLQQKQIDLLTRSKQTQLGHMASLARTIRMLEARIEKLEQQRPLI